jgi:hypothetical protein
MLLIGSGLDGAVGSLSVRTYDRVGVGDAELALARDVASAILAQGGVEVAWHDCSAACGHELTPHDILLRITTTPATAPPATMGFSIVDLRNRGGRLATVYGDRVRAAALRTGVSSGALLGRAIAHEIVHLRLGTAWHSATGLMRARWLDRELRRDHAADWILTPDVVARLGERGSPPRSHSAVTRHTATAENR